MKIKVSMTKIIEVDDDTLDLINDTLINRERNQFIETTHLDEKSEMKVIILRDQNKDNIK